MEDDCEAKSLEEKLGPTIVFNSPVEYLGGGLHCISFKYDLPGNNQLHLAYDKVASVFVDGKLRWQNQHHPTTEPVQAEGAELVLAPDLLYKHKKEKTLRFGRADDTTKENLKIIAKQVSIVYYGSEQRWL